MQTPVERPCPTCRAAPLREITEGVFICAGCRLVARYCVCPWARPAIEDYMEAALS